MLLNEISDGKGRLFVEIQILQIMTVSVWHGYMLVVN
jgi:hypothetical protein